MKKLFAAIFFIYVLAVQAPSSETETEVLISEADTAMAVKDFAVAAQKFAKLEALKANVPETFSYQYGIALFETGKTKQAKLQFCQYIRTAGENGEFYNEAVNMYAKTETKEAEEKEIEESKAYARAMSEKQVFALSNAAANGDAVALESLRRNARNGSFYAQQQLGLLYSNGHGVPQDPVLAANWFRKAAEQGYAPAQHNLGDCYHDGHGVPVDYAEAVYWFRKASEQGSVEAMTTLGYSYLIGEGLAKDKDKGLEWFLKAAEAGSVAGMYAAGHEYARRGLRDQAIQWLSKAASNSLNNSEYDLLHNNAIEELAALGVKQ